MRLPKSRETEERMIEESESPIHDPLPMKIIFNLFFVLSYCVVILRTPRYWLVRVVSCNFKLGG